MTPVSIARTTDLSLDDALTCLSNERRRHTIEIVDDHGEQISLSEISERVAARQYDVDRRELSSKKRKCVYTGLYQAHMGILTEAGAVEFNERAKTLAPAENTAVLARTIETLREQFPTG